MRWKFVVGDLRQVGDEAIRLTFVANSPYASAFLVSCGMVARDLVVGDDPVVPIGDVQASIGAEGDGDRTEHGI